LFGGRRYQAAEFSKKKKNRKKNKLEYNFMENGCLIDLKRDALSGRLKE